MRSFFKQRQEILSQSAMQFIITLYIPLFNIDFEEIIKVNRIMSGIAILK